jgi:hypothetical protein
MEITKKTIFGKIKYVFCILILLNISHESLANTEWLESELNSIGMTTENFTSIFPPEEIENFSSLFSPKLDKSKTLMFFYFGVKDSKQLEDTAIRLSEAFPSITDINQDVLLNFLNTESESKKLGLSLKEYVEIYISFVQLTWKSGKKYNGQVKNENIPHGKGTMTWSDGKRYAGDFKEGKRDGKGTTTFPNGNKYVGDYKEDERNGKGTFTWYDGENYVGDFVDGWRTGKGIHTYVNGDVYVGEQKNSKRHGFGKYTWADGSVSEGIWENGDSPEKVEARNKKQFVPYAVCLGGNKEPQIKTMINLFSSNNNPAAVSYMLDVGCNNSWGTPIPGKDLEEFTRNRNFVGVKNKEFMSGIGWIYAMIQVDKWDSY